jgi:hypothetical protein
MKRANPTALACDYFSGDCIPAVRSLAQTCKLAQTRSLTQEGAFWGFRQYAETFRRLESQCPKTDLKGHFEAKWKMLINFLM